jgi:hypothetical protein
MGKYGIPQTEEIVMMDIARPTDQGWNSVSYSRLPNIPSMKVYLNLVYNTGFQGSPAYAKILYKIG